MIGRGRSLIWGPTPAFHWTERKITKRLRRHCRPPLSDFSPAPSTYEAGDLTTLTNMDLLNSILKILSPMVAKQNDIFRKQSFRLNFSHTHIIPQSLQY